jgi:hypothetical protein
MTGQDFMNWLSQFQSCEITTIEGRNITGFSLRITCKKTGRSYYYSGPFGNTPAPVKAIKEACDELWLNYPPGI